MVIIRVNFAVIYHLSINLLPLFIDHFSLSFIISLSIFFLFVWTTFPYHLLSFNQSSSSSHRPLFPVIYYLSIILPLLLDHLSLSFIIFLSVFFAFLQTAFHCHLLYFYQSSSFYRSLFLSRFPLRPPSHPLATEAPGPGQERPSGLPGRRPRSLGDKSSFEV